jgi:PEP-CTERM motif
MLHRFASNWLNSAALKAGICACAVFIIGAAGPGAAATVTNVTPVDSGSAIIEITSGSPVSCFDGATGGLAGIQCVTLGAGNTISSFQPNVFPLTETFPFGSASVINIGPGIDPSLQASVNAANANTLGQEGGASLTATITYDFVINGPSGPVTVDFSGQVGGDTMGANAQASTSLQIITFITSGQGLTPSTVYFGTGPITGPQQQAVSLQFSLTAGQDYVIGLTADASVKNCCSTFPQSASAFFDPMITIDPSTPDAAAYSLAFSPNLTSTGAIPEPSTWVLLLAGFGGLALTGRQSLRKRAVTAPAVR